MQATDSARRAWPGAAGGWLWQSLLGCAAILVVAATVVVRLYRKLGT